MHAGLFVILLNIFYIIMYSVHLLKSLKKQNKPYGKKDICYIFKIYPKYKQWSSIK